MNTNISRLVSIAQKETRMIIGLMSGTSLDGLDVALCDIQGSGFETTVKIKAFETIDYAEDFKLQVRSISKKNIDLEHLCLMNEQLGVYHATIILNCLDKWNIQPAEVDLVASHGQTIYHAPRSFHGRPDLPNGTLQIGDGDHIAVKTGIITISDFRQKNIAAGGEGAPLALYGDVLMFSKPGENRLLLNIGGIANFTWLPGEESDAIFSTDVGPGNTLMDAFTQKHFNRPYDKDGLIASTGTINIRLLQALKQHDFFSLDIPKTTGPELFNLQYIETAIQRSGVSEISPEDILCTLNKFTADGITDAINSSLPAGKNIHVICSGGGIHNPLLMNHLKTALAECTLQSTAEYGIIPDAKEAVLFAVLANECIHGKGSTFKQLKNVPPITMGKISLPW